MLSDVLLKSASVLFTDPPTKDTVEVIPLKSTRPHEHRLLLRLGDCLRKQHFEVTITSRGPHLVELEY